jgi:Leucine-rich repeat (LRR) protein
LTELPEEIGKLKNLTTLNLSNNRISKTLDAIAEFKNLTTLNLSGNKISEIPDVISESKNLTYLYLNGNQISEIPDLISELKNLTYLYLNGNQISKIPSAIAGLKNLRRLYLSGNKISEIPDAIAELKNLTYLYLNGNQMSEIPDVIAELKNLEVLNLSRNKISVIPDAIAELKNLTELDLSYNQISEIPEIIIQLEKLNSIKIENNLFINPSHEIVNKGIDAIRIYLLNQQLSRYKDDDTLKIERSIEFPPEYWTAGNSILSYFSSILNAKYPDQNIKVRIQQEGLLLRMIIDTPEGQTETIEKTFNDYLMVISRQLPPENLLDSRKEIEALERKLEIAELELRLERRHSIKAIESLEMQISQLFSLIGQSFEKDHHTTVNITQELSNQHGQGDNFGGDNVNQDKIGRDKL